MTFVPDISRALSGPNDPHDESHATYVPEVSKARGANKSATGHLDPSTETYVAAALTGGGHPNSNAPGRRKEDDVNLVAHGLTSEGADASEDGTGRGTPLVVIQDARGVRDKKQNGIGLAEEGPMYTLDSVSQHAVAYGIRSDAQREGQARTPSPDAEGKVRLRDPGFNILEEQAPTLDAGAPHSVAYGVSENQRAEVKLTDIARQLSAGGGKPGQGYPAVAQTLSSHHQKYDSAGSKGTGPVNLIESNMAVRRLTPTECERLQGFPDGWTEGFSDSGRYRMLGNAVCVPVSAWIGRRIAGVDAGTSNSINSDAAER